MDTLKEVKALRTFLQNKAALYRMLGTEHTDLNLARKMTALADEALDAMSAPGGEAISNAREVSRWLNQTYRTGTIGEILGTQIDRAKKVAPDVTLEKAIGSREGAVAASRLREMRGAVDTPEANEAVKVYATLEEVMNALFGDKVNAYREVIRARHRQIAV